MGVMATLVPPERGVWMGSLVLQGLLAQMVTRVPLEEKVQREGPDQLGSMDRLVPLAQLGPLEQLEPKVLLVPQDPLEALGLLVQLAAQVLGVGMD